MNYTTATAFTEAHQKGNLFIRTKTKTKKIEIIDSIDFLLFNPWQNKCDSVTPCDVMILFE